LVKRVLIPFREAIKVKPYEEAVRGAGLEPISILTSGSIALDGAAGLLLMGGTDVNPRLYGAPPQPETDQPDDERDALELKALEEALRKNVPVLAICRGLQLLNVHCGGTLIQHLASPRHDPAEIPDRGAAAHEVAIEPDSLLAQIAGATRWQVNSRHHQAVAKIGSGLQVSARDAADGTIEGLELPGKRFVVAVQWHPEDQLTRFPEQLRLFERFAAAYELA